MHRDASKHVSLVFTARAADVSSTFIYVTQKNKTNFQRFQSQIDFIY